MKTVLLACFVASATLFAGSASAQTPQKTRGELLYETHCIACHTTQVHWREKKTATDLPSLRAEVRRWQTATQLNWSEDDITEVTRHLNQSFYRFTQPGSVVSAAPNGRIDQP